MNPHSTLIELEQNVEKLTNVYKTNAAKLSRQSSLAFNDYTVNPLLRAMNELLKEYRARYDQHREQINELEKQNQYKDFVNNNQAINITKLEELVTELRKSTKTTDELVDGFNKELAELKEQKENLQARLLDLENKLTNKDHTIRRLDHEKQELIKQVQKLDEVLTTSQPITREMLKQIEQEHSHKYDNAPPEPCTFEELVGEPMANENTVQFGPLINQDTKMSDIEVLNTINEILNQPEKNQNLEIHSVWAYNNETFRLANSNDLNKNVLFSDKGIAEAYYRPEGKLIKIDPDHNFPYIITNNEKNYAFKYAFIRLSQPSQPEQTKFSTGAVRSTDANSTRYDLISPVGLRRIAETYAEGAKKYGDNNWQKGIPASDTMNHAIRHLNLWLSGDHSEDHLAHAAWNLIAIMHFEELKPDCIDVPTRRTT